MGFDLVSTNNEVENWHCSFWTWRPVHYIIAEVSEPSKLFTYKELKAMSDNEGFFVDHLRATKLAPLIQGYLKDMACIAGRFPEEVIVPSEQFRVDENGFVLSDKQLEDPDVYRKSFSPYRISITRLNEFIEFCNESQGFGIH